MNADQLALCKRMWCAVMDGIVETDDDPTVDATSVALAAIDHIDPPEGVDPALFARTLKKMAACLLAYFHGDAA